VLPVGPRGLYGASNSPQTVRGFSGRMTAALFSAAMLAFLLLPQRVQGDDSVRRVMITQLADGIKPETKYSFIQPVVSLPVFWVLDHLRFGIYALTLLPILWMSLWALTVWTVLTNSRSPAFAHHVVVLTVSSLAGAYLIGFSSDVFTALAMSGGVIVGLLGRSRGARITAWGVFILGAANTPAMFPATAFLAAYLVARRREIRYALLPAGVFMLMVIEATTVSGRLAWTRYSDEVEHGSVELLPWGDVHGFGWPLWSGLLALLFSFGRGLVFYIPTMWNGVSRPSERTSTPEYALWFVVLALLPIYATWWAWFGGVSFGPRFFTIAVVPAAMATASLATRPDRSVLRSVVAAASVLMSLWVAVAGVVFGVTAAAFDWCASGGGFNNFAMCLYTPEYSSLWAPIWIDDHIGLRDCLFVVTMVVLVCPTIWVLVHPCIEAARRSFGSLRAHMGGPWRI
jgi:hypothetical protein